MRSFGGTWAGRNSSLHNRIGVSCQSKRKQRPQVSRILKNHARYWGGWLAVFGDYKPWGVHRQDGGNRSDYPEYSGRILDLKQGNADAVATFKAQIEPELADGIAIAVVPGHDPEKAGKGLQTLAAELASKGHRIDASACLVRTEKVAKLAHGGDRSEEVHTKSVRVANAYLIKGRDVLLLDDVSKTGNSLRACQKLLLEAGARSVECATIGKT
jgi:phosphoribosylpyrophosphate synthetase